MEIFKVENLSFSYPAQNTKALDNISITINKGDFVCVMGKSGCGKTTLLKLLKPNISPHGDLNGSIYFNNKNITELTLKESAGKIGFVMQKADAGIVCDKVWHELAFGLENLGVDKSQIRRRVSEMASFFGIEKWFHHKTHKLSGGQKQILSLASVMVMQPEILILDEPTSQLDPIASGEFLNMLKRINSELGVTVLISEHRLEEIFPVADNVIVLDDGKVISSGTPQKVAHELKDTQSDMYLSLPAPMRVYGALENNDNYPLTITKGRLWLEEYEKKHPAKKSLSHQPPDCKQKDAVCFKNVWFRYSKNDNDIIKGMNFTVKQNEIFAFSGGNGCGKTTTLSLISGLLRPYRGKILINSVNITKIKNLYNGTLGVVPQDVQTLFVKNTLGGDLADVFSDSNLPDVQRDVKIKEVLKICRLENLTDRHPYDLSGGEQQRAALAKILLLNPQILLLDEPTKGFDAHFKQIFGEILKDLKKQGKTIIIVSHDIEFCASFADRCALVFDGDITSTGNTKEFFATNTFYTTSINKMAKTTIPLAVTTKDLISVFN